MTIIAPHTKPSRNSTGTIANSIIFSLLIIFLISACAKLPTKDVSPLNQPIAPVKFTSPQSVTWKLANGLQVMFIEDHELPMVRGSMFFRGGSIWEPEQHRAVTSAMGSQLREGGAGDLDPDQLDEVVDQYAATLGSSFGGEYGRVNFVCLAADVNTIFDRFADVIRRPRFDERRFSLLKQLSLEAIRRRTDDAGTVAQIALSQLLFGDTIYGAPTVSSDIEKMIRADLLSAYKQFVRPSRAILAVAGNISRDQLAKMVEDHFGDWTAPKAPLPEPAPATFVPRPGIYMVRLPFQQANVVIGQQGVARFTKDQYAIDAFNYVFGDSGFSARLMKVIRDELGLSYDIQGAIVPGLVKGSNIISVQTKSATTAQTIVESLKVLADMQKKPVPEEELREAKAGFRNSFVFKFDATEEVLGRKAVLETLGFPSDYDRNYLSRIDGVTPAQIKDVAAKRWDLSKLVILVVGDETAYNSLKALVNNPPDILKGYELKTLDFKEKLLTE